MDDWYNEDGQHGTAGGVAVGGVTQKQIRPSGVPTPAPTTGGTLGFGNNFYPGPQAEYGNHMQYTDQSGVGQRIGGDDEEDYSNEPPILEELGVNFEHIWVKTKAVMVPIGRNDSSLHMEDADLVGPLVFCLVFGILLLLKGKVHFGYIYGFGVSGCCALSLVLTLLQDKSINFWHTSSILGYCLLPVICLSVVNILIYLKGVLGLCLSAITVLWSATASTKLFEEKLGAREQRWLIFYPVCLLYSTFVLITIF